MQIILLDKITNLGSIGDQVNVKAGYARNYLIPKGKAITATPKNIEYFKTRRIEVETKQEEIKNKAKKRAAKINQLGSITLIAKSRNEGKLFGSINSKDIADAITKQGINVTKNEVRLLNGTLRNIGKHNAIIQLYGEISANIDVIIIPET